MDKITEILSNIDLNSLLTIFDIQMALAILIISFLLRNILARIVIRIGYKIAKKEKKNPKDSRLYHMLGNMFLVLGIYIACIKLPFGERISYLINQTFKIILILFLTKLITTLISTKYVLKILHRSENDSINELVCKIINFIIWLVAIFIVIAEIGYDLSGLVTGLGIGSAIIALAAQELVKNLLSGASILTDKPFVIGDWIEVGTFAGTVVDIAFRSTRIKTINNTVVTIPNSVITSEYIINWNRLKSRRLDLALNLELNTASNKIKKIIKEINLVLSTNSNVIEDTVQVFFSEISTSSCEIKMYMYINKIEYVDFIKAKEEILCNLLTLIEKENIELAYPKQTIYLKNKEGETV